MPGDGAPFEPGHKLSKGRPPGSRNRMTPFQEALEIDGVATIQQIRLRALASDPTAMRLCMERLVPVLRAPNPSFHIPPVATVANLMGAISAVTEAVADGQLSPLEGEAVAKILECHRRTLEVESFDARLRALERARLKDE
jgi:hypothetical protein